MDNEEEIFRSLGRIESKLESFGDQLDANRKHRDRHDGRIRELEKSKWKVTGAVGAASAIGASALVTALKKFGITP